MFKWNLFFFVWIFKENTSNMIIKSFYLLQGSPLALLLSLLFKRILSRSNFKNILGIIFSCIFNHSSKNRKRCNCGISNILYKKEIRLIIFNSNPVIHDNNFIVICDCVESMSDCENCWISELFFDYFLNQFVCSQIQICSGFVENKNFTIFKNRSC